MICYFPSFVSTLSLVSLPWQDISPGAFKLKINQKIVWSLLLHLQNYRKLGVKFNFLSWGTKNSNNLYSPKYKKSYYYYCYYYYIFNRRFQSGKWMDSCGEFSLLLLLFFFLNIIIQRNNYINFCRYYM